jgi:hypothetical protein
MGCATLRHSDEFPPLPQIPVLTVPQLLGLERPPDLVQDPETKQWAMAEVMAAYRALQREGESVGWKIVIVSGYRSFNMQRHLWNRKFKESWDEAELDEEHCVRGVFEYTTVPGLSRHHWGTELDLGEYHIRHRAQVPVGAERPRMEDFYAWLDANAPRFGFCKVYKGVLGAIQEEPWHWSYQRYSSKFQKQCDQIADFSSLPIKSVMGWEWVLPHFTELRRLTQDSVTDDCHKTEGLPVKFLKVQWLPMLGDEKGLKAQNDED